MTSTPKPVKPTATVLALIEPMMNVAVNVRLALENAAAAIEHLCYNVPGRTEYKHLRSTQLRIMIDPSSNLQNKMDKHIA